MALAAVAALDDNVKSWLVYWRKAGAPESAAEIIGEVSHPEPPTYTESVDYLARDATKGTLICLPMDDNGTVITTTPRVEWPIARRGPEVAPQPQAQQQPDLEKLLAGIGQAINNAVAPLAQRLNELEQRGAASQMPVANAMGMGMDPFTVKLLERVLTPQPPPPRSPIEDQMMALAIKSLTSPKEVDEVTRMTNLLFRLEMQDKISKRLAALGQEPSDDGDKDDKDEGVDMVGLAREAMSMLSNRGGQQQQPQQTQQAQQLAGPTNIFESPEALEAAIIANPDQAMMAMKALASKNPTISKLARQTLREGENEGAK